MSGIARAPFFHTRADRIDLARQRYFEDGIAPSGIVSEAVFQSWTRCQRLHANPAGEVVFQPVSASRTNLSLQKNRPLHEAWAAELPALETILGTTTCAGMLTDATGLLIGATCAGRAHEHLMPIATRLGVDLSEEAVGTTAPGVVARTGRPVCVQGAEHFFDDVKAMNCAAAPVRDVHGRVAGVLDISSESMPFNFDAASVVGLFAGAIENRLLVAQARDHLVVHLQVAPTLLDSPVVGLIGVDTNGYVAWCNGVASRLLGLSTHWTPVEQMSAEAALGADVSSLMALLASGTAVLRLPNGLRVWARAALPASDGHRNVVPVPPEPPPPPPREDFSDVLPDQETVRDPRASLRECDRDLIGRTIAECGGNISKAAKKLSVSRGLIYRRLRNPGMNP
jgi:sigma-54 dependent transcriptional regulator, acetoin dehydrogenase operon transcriptional activator AcoR